ncbi:MAG: T9SS type A sorting domain-containing protein [bacterium]|nr:T9SS type A sorting domain-containing protein [bacterium]
MLFLFSLIFISGTKAQWSSNPQVNLAVCSVDFSQSLTKIVATSDGGCFISWFDLRGNGRYKVYLQKLNSLGIKQFASDGLLISDKPQNSWLGDYDLQNDGQDNALLVFSDIRNSTSDTIANPFAYKISSTGQFLWGANGVTLTNDTGSYQVWPKVAALSDGSTAVAWWTFNPAQHNTWITMQKISAAGVTQFATPIAIQDPGGLRYQYPDVCAAENGNFILSWVYGPLDTGGSFIPNNITIFTNKYNSSGNPVWNTLPKVYTSSGENVPVYMAPRIQSDGNGGAFYSYYILNQTALDSRVQRINSSGTFLFPSNGSSTSLNSRYDRVGPSIAFVPGTGETFVFWSQKDAFTQDHFQLSGQKLSSTGTRLWGDSGIAYTPLDSVQLFSVNCLAKDTNVVVTFEYGPILPSFITLVKAISVGRNGNQNWNGSTLDVSTASSYKENSKTAMNSSGMTMVCWVDSRGAPTPENGSIYAQNINLNGTLGPVGITQISQSVPENYSLKQNFPNPFNNSTVIEFEIKNNGNYKFEVYDMLGKKVDEVFNDFKSHGTYRINYDAGKLSSGMYMYKLLSGEFSLVKKFILVK